METNHLLLHDPLKFVLGEDTVKVLQGRAQDSLARCTGEEKDRKSAIADFGGDHLEGGKVDDGLERGTSLPR